MTLLALRAKEGGQPTALTVLSRLPAASKLWTHLLSHKDFLQGAPQRNFKASSGEKLGIKLGPEVEGRNKAVCSAQRQNL